jgi:hypothetical protein
VAAAAAAAHRMDSTLSPTAGPVPPRCKAALASCSSVKTCRTTGGLRLELPIGERSMKVPQWEENCLYSSETTPDNGRKIKVARGVRKRSNLQFWPPGGHAVSAWLSKLL